MPITTADWLRYVESLGPADTQSLQLRLQAAGLDSERAKWIASLTRRRELARKVSFFAIFILLAGLAWCAYQWSLALRGDPAAPGVAEVAKSAGVMIVGAFTLLIAAATEQNVPLDVLAHPYIPSSLGGPPRRVSVSTTRASLVRLMAGMFALPFAFITFVLPQVRDRTWLQQHGVETQGEVTRTYTTKGSKGRVRYHVDYQFEGRIGSDSIGRDEFDRLHVGDRVPVTYLPSRPEINTPQTKAAVDSRPRLFSDRRSLLPLLFLFTSLPLIAVIVRSAREKQLKIAEKGVAVVGTAAEMTHQTIYYSYPTPGGMKEGRFNLNKRPVRERPRGGEPLVVLYDPAKPDRSVPLGTLGDLEIGG